MEQYRFYKCRCLNYLHQRITGIWLMSGTWKVHESLHQRIYPYGLHREFYQVIDIEGDIFSSDNVEFIKIRNSNRLHRL